MLNPAPPRFVLDPVTKDIASTSPTTPTPIRQLVKDIQTLAAWGHGTLGQSELASVLSAPRLDWPKTVQQALNRVLSAPTVSIGASKLAQYDLRALLPELLDRFTDGELLVLRHCLFTLAPLTQVAVAKRAGISRQRISQLQANAIRRLDSVLGGEDAAPLRWTADLLRTKLGNAIPVDAPTATRQFGRLGNICGATLSKSAIPTREFFLYIAGPYSLDDGWLIRRDNVSALESLIHPEFHRRWMEERTSYRYRTRLAVWRGVRGQLWKHRRASSSRPAAPWSSCHFLRTAAGNGDRFQFRSDPAATICQ